MKYAYKTDIGKVREKNEDSAMIVDNKHGDIFMMVFDGMGGHNLGDIASMQAQTYLCKCFHQKEHFKNRFDMKTWLRKSIRKTNEFLNKFTEMDPTSKGMGTTFACYLVHNKDVVVGYIGDTRAYSYSNKVLKQHSHDETYVEFLYQSGKITKEEMKTHPSRHVITNALGCYPSVIINITHLKSSFDYLLLCSDGLYNMVSEEEICAILEEHDQDVSKAVDALVQRANDNGGKDNIACALLKGDN